MGWFKRSNSLLDDGFWSLFWGRQSASGVSITDAKALQLSAFWSCLRLTSSAIASMSLQQYKYSEDGKSRKPLNNELNNILAVAPNAEQTPFEFWQMMTAWMMARGNAYAERRERSDGTLISLEPIPSNLVSVKRNSDGALEYTVAGPIYSGEVFPAEKIFHLRNFSMERDAGLSVIHNGIQSLGMAYSADESAAKLFANGLQTSGILTTDGTLKADQRKQLQEVMSEFTGSKNAHKMMILEAGLKFAGVTLNPAESQLLETRRFNIEDICRWFGVPPILIGHASQGQTMWGSGVEQIMIGWLTTGLNPMIRNIETRIRKDLVPSGQRSGIKFRFNRETLLQADSQSKIKYLSGCVQNGLMTRNEAREKLDLDRMDGGDVLTAQTNLAPLGLLGQISNNDRRSENADEET